MDLLGPLMKTKRGKKHPGDDQLAIEAHKVNKKLENDYKFGCDNVNFPLGNAVWNPKLILVRNWSAICREVLQIRVRMPGS